MSHLRMLPNKSHQCILKLPRYTTVTQTLTPRSNRFIRDTWVSRTTRTCLSLRTLLSSPQGLRKRECGLSWTLRKKEIRVREKRSWPSRRKGNLMWSTLNRWLSNYPPLQPCRNKIRQQRLSEIEGTLFGGDPLMEKYFKVKCRDFIDNTR